ncbi:MAG: response regulator [Proteobacteria bacterium]|nr:response regulator [Pseudomonadota bacterium]
MSKKKILVIDDEKPTLKLFRLLLDAFGYDTITAENGKEGLEAFAAERPDIILTDIKMPIMDGIEVLENIKKMNPRAEVIIITGHGDMELAIKSLNLDATDFINKPVHREALEIALKRAEERLAVFRQEQTQVSMLPTEQAAQIHLRGNISVLSVPGLKEAFASAREHSSGTIDILFEKSVSINGAGIATLTELLAQCRDQGLEVRLLGLSTNFKTVFKMVGISNLAEVVDEKTSPGSKLTH